MALSKILIGLFLLQNHQAFCQEACQPKSTMLKLPRYSVEIGLDSDGPGLSLQLLDQHHGRIFKGTLGANLPNGLEIIKCDIGQACFQFGDDVAQLSVTQVDDTCHELKWTSRYLNSIEDCFELDTSIDNTTKWFVGPEEFYQHFPLNESFVREQTPYLPGDMLQDRDKYFGGVAEPYWLSSKGVAIWVPEGVPLFYSFNSQARKSRRDFCLSAKSSPPYEILDHLVLKYRICAHKDTKSMHMYAVNNMLGKPIDIPDELMMRAPIWSSWAQFKADINQSTIVDFARRIHDYGFKVSQIEIDDKWEKCYGDAIFDLSDEKFPDPFSMISTIKNEFGYRVTLWIHPFVNLDCSSWQAAALPPSSYFVRDKKGKDGVGNLPGLVWWWQGVLASYVDFTNPQAVNWWSQRLEDLRATYGIDSFKFDAGESNWLPSSILLNEEIPREQWPAAFTTSYVKSIASKFGRMIEVRVGLRTQSLPTWVRMLDKDSRWGFDNGLKTLVTTLLQMSLSGYPFVLPDMIGGNGYGDNPLDESDIPSRELYIRWLQANVFMPSMQFSFVPWLYDQEVVAHTQEMINLRDRHADLIVSLAKNVVETGEPINRPIWWVADSRDETAFSIEDQFMLGDDILVAPVLEEGARSRDIYLPKGQWRDASNDQVYQGPMWLTDYKVDLFSLPYFARLETTSESSPP